MSKTLARVLAAILVLCMLPATFLTALAHGYGVAKDETENQSIDNANGQYIPETIQIDGVFNDTGWPIEGWNYVTSSSGNWNVTDPAANSQEMMYQYQLRADYKYFYGAAVVVFPETIDSVNFVIYLSNKNKDAYELTTSTITFALDNTGAVEVSAKDCDTSDACTPDVTNIDLNDRYEKKNGNHVFYLEFCNLIAVTYDASATEIRYYVSLDSYYTESGKSICNSLYHPIYYTNEGSHCVPTSEFWPGGGDLLEVSYTDLSIRYKGSMYHGSTQSQINSGTDGFKGAVELDGALNEEIWKGLNGYYTLSDGGLVDFVNADKGIINGSYSNGEYIGTSSNLADVSTVYYLPNNLVAGNEYFASPTVRELKPDDSSGTHASYADDGYELTDGKIVNDYAYLTDEPDDDDYHNDKFCVWNVHSESADDDLGETVGADIRIPLGNGVDAYPLQVVRIYTATDKCNPKVSENSPYSNGIWNQTIVVEYTDDGITWKAFGSIEKDDYRDTYTRENVVSVTTPVMAKGIRITSTGDPELLFLSEIEAYSSTAIAEKANSYNNSTTAANAPDFVGKYDFRVDDEYFYGALITAGTAASLQVGETKVTTSYLSDYSEGHKYEFRVKKEGLDFTHPNGVSVQVDGVRFYGMIVNHVDNDLSDEIKLDGKLIDSIWAPVTAGDTKFNYIKNKDDPLFDGYENIIYDVQTDYEYVYGAAIVKLEDIGTWTQETTRLRLYVNPYSYVGTNNQDERRIVELYLSDSSNIKRDDLDRSFARVLKYDGDTVLHENMSYRWSELCYIRKDTENNTLTFEFKIPYKLFGWEGPVEEDNKDANSEFDAKHQLNTDIAKADSETLFTYYMSIYSTATGTTTETFFSKGMTGGKAQIAAEPVKTDDAYKKHSTTITYGDILDTVKIDGHLDDAVWHDENKQFYHADFANSTVLDEPKVGRVYDYSYMLYGGSNYIYGAVEFNSKAKSDTTFTLWINNFVDETKWIGDNDPKTPHIIYDVYSIDAKINEYTGAVVNGSTQATGNKVDFSTNELKYYVNYKYEFNLAGGEAVVEPDYYFPTDSNLESDKVKIVKDVNYKYAVTSINGKTYLEFMIDVDNFNWDGNSFEYVTSMTHQVTKADDGAYSDEYLTIYHPQINDRANWWLTNYNSRTTTLPDGNGILYTDADMYDLPPTAHMYAFKFEPVESSKQSDGTYAQYRMIEKRSGYRWYRFDTDGVTILDTYNPADSSNSATAAEWQPYTKEESNNGIIMFAYYGGQYWSKGHRGSHHTNSILTYTNRRPVDYVPVHNIPGADNKTTDLYYVAANVFDSITERGDLTRKLLFDSWQLGDIVEFGVQDTDTIENKKIDKNVLYVTGDSLGTSKRDDLIYDGQSDDMYDIFGNWSVNFSNEHKSTLTLGNDLGFTYKYADYAEMSEVYYNETYGGYTGFTGGDGIYGNGKLNDDLGPGGGSAYTVIAMDMNRGGEKRVSEIIAKMDTAQQTNVYTAYLAGGFGGVFNDSINMEIYGSNDEQNWNWITAASYRQLILSDGDGVTRYVYNDAGELESQYADNVTRTVSRIWLDDKFNANVTSSSSMGVMNDNADVISGLERKAFTDLKTTLGGKAAIFTNSKAATVNEAQSFRICAELSGKVDVDSVSIGWVTEVFKANIGHFGREIKVYTSDDGDNWTYKTQATSGAAISKYRVTDSYYAKKMHADTSRLYFDDHVNTKYIALEFTIPKIESVITGLSAADKAAYLSSTFGTLKTWEQVAITEIDFTNHPLDDYTLTAVAEEPVTYQYIKFRFTKIDTANNAVGIEELDLHYSQTLADMPKKTILHLNTDQGYTQKVEQTAGQHDYVLGYKGKYNTSGEVWDNDTNDEKYTKHNNISNVMAETVLYPNYALNMFMDTGFFTNYYIERVGSAAIDQPSQPQDNSTDNWDGRNSNVLKPLEHIAPDVIDIDGNLNDVGWDGTWTDVDGLMNATNTSGTGIDYTYQIRADGEYLYVGALLKSNYEVNKPEFKLWIKTDDTAKTFTHLYTVGAGETVLEISEQENSYDFAEGAPYLVYQYGKEQIDGSITINGKIGAIAKNDATKPTGLTDITDKSYYLGSDIFGYTKEVVESTHDGIWVWEANPLTEGHRVALEHACINSASGKTVNNVSGDEDHTIVEFRVKLDEFDGADGFEYFLEVTSTQGGTIYPHVYTEDGYTEYHHPSWSWDSNSAEKVTPEDMTGWGIYRMVNDYAPMTSLGAKINPTYGENNQRAIRFGARYTEEFIRRQANVEGIDYWDVADAGIVFAPTHVVDGQDPDNLTVDTDSAKVVAALDIVNWKNETADSKTNFADYTTFVFYVNLVGIPDGAINMPFAFRGFVDYYEVSGCDTYYGIPLERSYSLVERTNNEAENLPKIPTVKISYDNSTSLYSGTEELAVKKLTDGYVPLGTFEYKAAHQDGDDSYAQLFKNNTYKEMTTGSAFSLEFKYEDEHAVDAIFLGLFMMPEWNVAPPKVVTLSIKDENGNWIASETHSICTQSELENLYPSKGYEYNYQKTIVLGQEYVGTEFKLTFAFPEFVYNGDVHDDNYENCLSWRAVGLTEVSLG